MKKIEEHIKGIIIGILLAAGAAAAFFGHALWIQGGVTCLCWGLAVLVVTIAVQQNGNVEIASFEEAGNEILRDIAINGQASEHYGLVDVKLMNKTRVKLQKRVRKQVISCASMGAILIMIAIICFV